MTRVTTKITYDMATMEVLEHEWYDYDGPVAECKGDSYAKQVSKDQFDLEKAQIAKQNAEFDFVKGNISKYLTGNEGFNPEQMAMLRSSFLNDNASAYSDAGSSVRDMLTARGGDGALPVGGNYVKGISGLLGAQASAKSSGLLNLGIMDQQQALNNKFNTASVLSGNGAALSSSIGSTAGAGSSALSDYIKSKSQGFGAHFMDALGSGLGGGIASIATGGLSGMLGKAGVPGQVKP
jgi:hypothetical protein